MAESDVGIVNMALSHLGDAAIVSSISPSDGSAQADHASRFYAQTRDWLLERFPWKFALTRTPLALVADVEVGSWAYVYGQPNKCLRIVNILPGVYTDENEGVPYETEIAVLSDGLETEVPVILTNAEAAVCRYIRQIVNPVYFSAAFTDVFSWCLAALLAGPIIKGETGRAEAIRCWQVAQVNFGIATALSANQARKVLSNFVPSNIAARGVLAGPSEEEGSFPISVHQQ